MSNELSESTMSVRKNEVDGLVRLGWEIHPEQIENPFGIVRLRKMIDLNRMMARRNRYAMKHGE